jgi:hypothetical protein
VDDVRDPLMHELDDDMIGHDGSVNIEVVLGGSAP